MSRLLLTGVVLLGYCSGAKGKDQPAPKAVDFNRDVRPILAGKCFSCHGPDDKVRKGKLRLDVRYGAAKVVTAAQPAKSELLRRITADDDEVMPPATTGKRLSEGEVATLRRWIEQGAPYAQHWAYVKPVRPTPPNP